jgi:hypothetical protein
MTAEEREMKSVIQAVAALAALGLVSQGEPVKPAKQTDEKTAPVKLSKREMASIAAGKITQKNPAGHEMPSNSNPPFPNTNPSGRAPPGQN